MSVHQLFYISRSRATSDDIEQILRRARERNAELGVTGALLFSGEHFAQLLEGDPVAVARIMSAIERDPRHEAATVLLLQQADKRLCPDWRMAFVEAPGAGDLIEQLLVSPQVSPERARRLLALMLEAAAV